MYTIHYGIPGCLPNVSWYAHTLGEAYQIALDWKEHCLECGDKVYGNIRRDWRYDMMQEGREYITEILTIDYCEEGEDYA